MHHSLSKNLLIAVLVSASGLLSTVAAPSPAAACGDYGVPTRAQLESQAINSASAEWVRTNTYGGHLARLEELRIRGDAASTIVAVGYPYGTDMTHRWRIELRRADGDWTVTGSAPVLPDAE